MKEMRGKSHTHLAAVRAGGDLQVCIVRWDDENDRSTWEAQTYDSDGNPMMVLGAFVNERDAFAMLPTLIELARDAYGPEHKGFRERDEFNMVAWRVRNEDRRGWEWSGRNDCGADLGDNVGETIPPWDRKDN